MSLLGRLTTLSAPDPTRSLKQDHDRFRALLKEAEKTTERSHLRRQRIFDEFTTLLALHENIEEQTLYAALKVHAKTRPIVEEGRQEHHVTDLLVAELAGIPVTAKDWGSKFHVMGECLEHHLGEEEDDMFPLVNEVLSTRQLTGLHARMEKMRARAENPRSPVATRTVPRRRGPTRVPSAAAGKRKPRASRAQATGNGR